MKLKPLFFLFLATPYNVLQKTKYIEWHKNENNFKDKNDIERKALAQAIVSEVQRGLNGIMEELFEDIQNEAYDYEDYEVVLPMLLYNKFKCVEHLGVTQDIAVWKDQSKI